MDEVTRKALEGIAEAEAWKPSEGPIVLSGEYLRLVERVEQLPENRPGADKTWTERVLEEWKKMVESATVESATVESAVERTPEIRRE